MRLSPEQVDLFKRHGFLAIPSATTADQLQLLRAVFERLFAERAGWEEGAQYDMLGHDDGAHPGRQPQISNPVDYAPELRHTVFRTIAQTAARQLLGEEARPYFEHAILKPAGCAAPTPWHQDEAYNPDAGLDYEQVSFWMPLQEVGPENGCMQYISGTHRGPVLQHRSADGDSSVQALECVPDEFDATRAVPCPLPAGGVAAHHGRTLHAATSNDSAAARYAYVLTFQLDPERRSPPQAFPWNRTRRTPHAERRRRWRRRGGALVELVRWRRRGGTLGDLWRRARARRT
jgi:hypothetical protein